LKRQGYPDENVLTIDQCQGQEADYVIFSLVQKPTRFLNKNRLNVALSRVRKRLYFVADKNEFQEASTNTSWDSNWIAKDLLQLSNKKGNVDVIYNGDLRLRPRSPSIYDLLNSIDINDY
jgi:superfamily I DNA and/or RNA helicase